MALTGRTMETGCRFLCSGWWAAWRLAACLAVLSFAVFHITALGVVFVIAALLLLALLLWITWIRRQYAFGSGGMMEQVHQVVLSHLDFDGQGQLLDVGCGSGALSIRAALI